MINSMPEEEIDWSQPLQEEEIDWSQPLPESEPFPGKGFALGLGQWAEDTLKGLASHGAEPEVDIPEFLKHPRVRGKPEVNRSPSFNFEQYVPSDQRLQFNVGRYGPDIATLGYGLAKGAAKLTPKAVGKGIVGEVKDLKKAFRDEYNSIFDLAEKKGVRNIESKANKADLEKILDEVDNKYYKGLQNFIDKPTIRNAHEAQSDLGKFIRKMNSKKELLSSEKDALKLARKTQDILKNEVYSGLMKEGGLELPFKYLDVTKRYGQEMVPYLENTAMRKAMLNPGQKGYIKPSRLPQKLKLESSDPLMAHLRGKVEGTGAPINPALIGKHPLLETGQFFTSPYFKYGLGVPTLGYGGYRMIDSLLGKG